MVTISSKRLGRYSQQQGYALIIVLAIVATVTLITTMTLSINAQGIRTIGSANDREVEYAGAERAINHAVAWLRANSQKVIYPFRRDRFYQSFSKRTPAVGANDDSGFNVPTSLTMRNTNNSVILATHRSLGLAQYPYTEDISTKTVYDAAAGFSGGSYGPDARVRITLLNAEPLIPAKDFGAPPSAPPQTDFTPVFKIDAGLNAGFNRGGHVSATVTSKLIHRFDYGVYGEDYLELRQPCDSYKSTQGDYSSGIKRAGCVAGSNSTAAVHKNEEVYGTLRTNGDINATAPFGGQTCADFAAGCPNKGETCAGADCGVPLLDDFKTFAEYCPTNLGDKTVNLANENLTLPPNAETLNPRANCWNSITIQNGAKLTLTKVGIPYYIKTLTFSNNSNSKLDINPDVAGGTIEIFVEVVTGNSFNGNQSINTTLKPTQFIFNYIGSNALTLNGNANMNLALTAPYASVTVSGSFEFKGALLAKRTYLTGSGGFHYDEDLGGMGPVTDAQFRIRDLQPFYR